MKFKRFMTVLFFVLTLFVLGGCKSTNGQIWHNGSSEPSNTIGVDGDVYLNTSSLDLFSKIAGEWNIVANIKGKVGNDGKPGIDGQPGADGKPGLDGISIKSARIENGELIIILSNGKEINAGSLDQGQEQIYTEKDARSAFYHKMKEKAASFGINVDKLIFNSAISESSGSVTSRDMAKLGMMALGYDELVKIWNQYEYTAVTTGVEKTFHVTSTVMQGNFSKYLTDHYYVLGGKTGGLANAGNGVPVSNLLVSVEGPDGATFVGFISIDAVNNESLNTSKIAKIAFDIASLRYLNKDADISELEEQIPGNARITVLAAPKSGNILAFNHYDWYGENSQYLMYDKNGSHKAHTASSWKILTVMTALDYISDLEERFTITDESIRTGAGPVFTGGEELTFRDLLHLILLPSSNSASVAVSAAAGFKILRTESQVGGGPIYDTDVDDFDFESAPVVSVSNAKANPNSSKILRVRGVVVGGTTNFDNGSAPMVIIKDEFTNDLIGIRGLTIKKSAYEVNLPFDLGDIIEVPAISEIVAGQYNYGGEANKLTLTWMGDPYSQETRSEFISKYKFGETSNYSIDQTKVTTIIESQTDLEEFLSTPGYHWELVILRGTEESPLKAVTGAATLKGKEDQDMTREYLRFFFNDASNFDEQKVDRSAPVLTNFGNLHNLDDLLSTMLFNQTEYAEEDFLNPYEFVGDVYCFVMGGSTVYYHFVVLDNESIVYPDNLVTVNYDSGFETNVANETIEKGESVLEPILNRDNYDFKGWFLEGESNEFDFTQPITKTITLYAKWEKHTTISIEKVIASEDLTNTLLVEGVIVSGAYSSNGSFYGLFIQDKVSGRIMILTDLLGLETNFNIGDLISFNAILKKELSGDEEGKRYLSFKDSFELILKDNGIVDYQNTAIKITNQQQLNDAFLLENITYGQVYLISGTFYYNSNWASFQKTGNHHMRLYMDETFSSNTQLNVGNNKFFTLNDNSNRKQLGKNWFEEILGITPTSFPGVKLPGFSKTIEIYLVLLRSDGTNNYFSILSENDIIDINQ